jgi:ABC-2 type transport system ATP-binding protein
MLLEVEHLSKRYGEVSAVDDVSFGVAQGEIVGLLGPNGAGKTTTIHMLLGLITPSAGEVRVFGRRFDDYREHILQQINFTSPYVSLPLRLTVMENLRVFAGLYDVEQPQKRIEELLRLFGIDKLRHQPIATLSSGENTRVGLCKAMLNRPRLLLLDEPTAYLDPEIALQVKQVLLAAQAEFGTTILCTSHNMLEVERMCSRIVFMHHGRVIAEGSPIEITRAILKEERNEPALEEVFLRVVRQEVSAP